MALEPLAPAALAQAPTVLASFMGEGDGDYKTVGELLAIYRERVQTLDVAEDQADDLRVERFVGHMMSDGWRDDIVIRIGVFDDDTVRVVDGIHRGIAYLACLEDGASPDRLPALHVDC